MTEVKGIGVDLAQIPRLRRVVERWDERFLRRVFTDYDPVSWQAFVIGFVAVWSAQLIAAQAGLRDW